jgi:DNA replication protein DnaC
LDDRDWVTIAPIVAPDYRNPVQSYGDPELSSLQLLHNRTFGNIDLRENENITKEDLQSLKNAFHSAIQFAENPQGWLVLMGNYGTGKTHLAAAIGNYWIDQRFQPSFVVVPDLFDHLRAAFNPNSTISLDRRFESVRRAHLLILDDLGTQSASPWVKEKLYQLFNYRYNAELPTVITTATSLEDMDPRLRSRMMDRRLCRIHAITMPPYTGSSANEAAVSRKRKRSG